MRTTPLLLLLAACGGWNSLPNQDIVTLDAPLWDPGSAIATADGIYVLLPESGGLALIAPGGEARLVENLGEGRVQDITAAPDGRTVVAFVDRFRCEPEDPDDYRQDPVLVGDCDEPDRVRISEMAVIRAGKAEPNAIVLDGTYNALAYSEDGRFAIAYLDFTDDDFDISGVVSLTSVVVLDLASGASATVPVGFAADQVLFVQNTAGDAEQAVVLSRNSVAVLDLTATVPERTVTFPLTLDPDSTVTPVGVSLTPDGQHALISVQGSADLYALDLVNQSINIIELTARPSEMSVNPTVDRTVFVYDGTPRVDILEHQFFETTSIDLDEGMNAITQASTFSLLWSDNSDHDLYRLELETNELVEYRLENPAIALHLAPTEEFAIALTRAEDGFNDGVEGIYDQNPGMEIIDLADDDTQPFLLEGVGLGVAWSVGDGQLAALVLQAGIDYLYQLDLYTGQSQQIELSSPPVAIGALPDGTFYVTHPDALGLVSFLDPATLEVTEVAGFATLGLVDPIELVGGDDEEEE